MNSKMNTGKQYTGKGCHESCLWLFKTFGYDWYVSNGMPIAIHLSPFTWELTIVLRIENIHIPVSHLFSDFIWTWIDAWRRPSGNNGKEHEDFTSCCRRYCKHHTWITVCKFKSICIVILLDAVWYTLTSLNSLSLYI